ncbi:MAG: SDR family oxidoreductase [Alphaproteobacteria bacterium]
MPAAQRVAIVTAASKGIGEACARELAERGYKLALISPSGACEKLAKALGGIGFAGSVTEEADIKRLVDATLDKWGRIDAVVNNSGRHASVFKKHGFEGRSALTAARLNYDPDFESNMLEIPDAVWHGVLDLIVLNVVRMCRHVTPHMIKQGSGAIVNISGMEASQPRVLYTTGPVRLALHGITKIYSDRYGKHGIRMNNVLPGIVENADMDAEEIRKAIPIPRRGTLAEMAKTVAFLLSEDAGYITGQQILVDGGLNRSI